MVGTRSLGRVYPLVIGKPKKKKRMDNRVMNGERAK